MPELPEVETVRKGLEMAICGRTIHEVRLRRKDLRFPLPPRFAEALEGRKILAVERRAKYLLIRISGTLTLLAHLGMSGHFSFQTQPEKPAKHDHVLFFFKDGAALVYNDPRRFGCMDLLETGQEAAHPLLATIGPEPFSTEFNPVYLREQLLKRKAPVKLALLDQSLVAGVGNIYACEALFRAGIDPRVPSAQAAAAALKLVAAVREVLEEAIASGGSSLRDFIHTDGETGYFQHAFAVYGREGKPCFTCALPVSRVVQGGRSTFWCEHCQQARGKSGDKSKKFSKTAILRGAKKPKTGA
jgi:formamidopyrimidine-DNA glycosylase